MARPTSRPAASSACAWPRPSNLRRTMKCTPAAPFDGETKVMGYFQSSRASFPDLKNEIIAVAAADGTDTVLVEFWLSGTHAGPFTVDGKTYEPTGRKFRVRMAASFEFAPN
ncbi:hypothetical protein CTI14_52410, partial [Methylobacterium radiotolerans]